ncbi:hypothetical protein [Thalassobacillus devorans]|uniref:hypothetical protein n=1 Tax=Thalassobacillus devorans TaxID=279813 RepID=UPI000A1CB4EF|nr:hypothetical protein [Thalassobacillus devorans]
MRKVYTLIFIMVIAVISSSCEQATSKQATIAKAEDSKYAATFEELSMGMLWSFEFYLPDADKRWVNVWVERYRDGEKDPDPVTQLSYGMSPNEVDEGNLGLAIISPELKQPSIFLYAPGVTQSAKRMEEGFNENLASAWGYGLGDEKLELGLGETVTLGGYRQASTKDSIKVQDFSSEASIEEMIDKDHLVLLLKMKIEEKTDLEE